MAEIDKSLSADDIVDIGEEHHKAGRLLEAESCYQKALELDPGHPGALYFLANIAYDDGRLPFAAQLINGLLRDEPNDAEAWHLLGIIALREEDFSRAVECFKKALAIQPEYAQAHYSLGDALGRRGEFVIALENFQKAVMLNPRLAEAHFAIGNILQSQSKLDAAISSYQQVINIKPNFELAYLNIGLILRLQGKLNEEIAIYREALVKLPDAQAIHLNLGIALLNSKQPVDALPSLERAILLDSNCADAHGNLGFLLLHQGKTSEAVLAFDRMVSLTPQNSHAWLFLADSLRQVGKLVEAVECWQQVIVLDPNNLEAHRCLLSYSQYLPAISREKVFADHVAFGERFETPFRAQWPKYAKSIDSQKRLRLGFVSADLLSHPVGFFLEGVLRELHRSNEIDIIVYSMNKKDDTVTDWLRASAHVWLPVTTLSDDAFAERIRDDKIDILVDLSGHTPGNRLLVFARKPAPIQVTWLGYWDTTGLRAMDYILCDPYGARDEEAKFYVEKLWFLPHTRLCFRSPNVFPVAPLPALSNGYVTFGCFNNLLKMTDRAVSVWSRVLKRVSNAHLLLKEASFANLSVCEDVAIRFGREGISADRLKFEAYSPFQEYLSAYNHVDIALDPFPFTGCTTSVQGISMGVPVITLRGDRMIARQGEGILHNIGLADWIAADEDDYVELAIQKAADLTSLARLRGELRTKLEASPLCDAKLFAQDLVSAFKQMWNRYCYEC